MVVFFTLIYGVNKTEENISDTYMILRKNIFIAFIFSLCTSIDVFSFFGFRISLIPLLIYGIVQLVQKKTVDNNIFFVLLFFLACSPSTIYSYALGKSLGYLAWILFNFLFISCVFKKLAEDDYGSTLKGIFYSYRFQIIVAAFLYFAHIHERAQFLYYEPSYFAIALIPYVVIFITSFIYKNKTINLPKATLFDLFLCVLAIYTTKSANLLLIFVVSMCVISLHGKNKTAKVALSIGFLLIAYISLYFYSKGHDDLISITFKNIFMSGNFWEGLIDRVGNRWYRVEMAYQVAVDHWWGIGIGAYAEYTLNSVSQYPFYNSLPWYLKPIGMPAINLYIEMAATSGWLALVIWLVWHYKLLYSRKRKEFRGTVIYFSLLISMIVLNIESSFMRPYYWVLIGICMAHCKQTFDQASEKISNR